jgi:hypothetical protein
VPAASLPVAGAGGRPGALALVRAQGNVAHVMHVRWTRWDSRVLLRAALVAALALTVAWLVTAATDEGGVRWGERAGRTLPLTPACAAIGVWIALQPVRSRGEARALEALGRSPAQVAAAAVAGGAAVAIVAAVAIGALARIDVAGFYPTAARVSAWRWDGTQFIDAARGLRVAADGAIDRALDASSVSVAANAIPSHGRAAAALTTAIAGLALPLLVAHALLGRPPGARPRREDALAALASGGAVASSVVLFQAAAARLAPAMLAVLPPALLLAMAVRRYRASP